MEDCFNLNSIDKSILELIKEESDVSDICREYLCDPNDKSEENLVKKFEIIEKKLLKVKENVVTMIKVIGDSDSPVDSSESDFIVKE